MSESKDVSGRVEKGVCPYSGSVERFHLTVSMKEQRECSFHLADDTSLAEAVSATETRIIILNYCPKL